MIIPQPHQIDGVAMMEAMDGRFYLGDEMGLGKTLQVLLYMQRNTANTLPALIICPTAAREHWKREAAQLGARACILYGTKPPPRHPRAPICIISYECVAKWARWLATHGFKFLCLDEIHYCSSRTTQQTKACQHIAKHIPRVSGCSGTPITNYPDGLWPALNMIRPDLYPEFATYAWQYCCPRKAHWGWVFDGASNTEELYHLLQEQMMIRRTKSAIELPPKRVRRIDIPLTNYDEYMYAEQNFIEWLRSRWGDKRARKATKAQAVVQVGYLKRLAAKLKFTNVCKWIDYALTQVDKLVVFAYSRGAIAGLQRRYPSFVTVAGGMRESQRIAAVDAFQINQRVRGFIGQNRSANTCITLTAACTLVATEPDWAPGVMDQIGARIHRISQQQTCHIYHMVAPNTVEDRVYAIQHEKRRIREEVIDGAFTNDTPYNNEESATMQVIEGMLGGDYV